VAGVSFRADAFIVFHNYLYNDDIERTVLVHEAGHLLGLEHDANAGCAMTGTLVENLSMRTGRILPPDDYCKLHRQQLEQARHNLF
jgi:predicted Zn-dependent protease